MEGAATARSPILRTSIVTGAGRGIGEAIAHELHARGDDVVVVDADGHAAERVTRQLDSSGESSCSVAADVRKYDEFATAVEIARQRHGRVDVLVNNAARTVSRSLWEIRAEEWDDVLAVNLRSVLFGCQIVGTHMRDQRAGRILNVASLAGQQGGLVAGAHYAASKAGVLVLTKIAARELAPHGVTVNAVAPAAIDGPVMRELGEQRTADLAASAPVGRLGQPEEVAALVGFLCSEQAGYISGACYDINGGAFMR